MMYILRVNRWDGDGDYCDTPVAVYDTIEQASRARLKLGTKIARRCERASQYHSLIESDMIAWNEANPPPPPPEYAWCNPPNDLYETDQWYPPNDYECNHEPRWFSDKRQAYLESLYAKIPPAIRGFVYHDSESFYLIIEEIAHNPPSPRY